MLTIESKLSFYLSLLPDVSYKRKKVKYKRDFSFFVFESAKVNKIVKKGNSAFLLPSIKKEKFFFL